MSLGDTFMEYKIDFNPVKYEEIDEILMGELENKIKDNIPLTEEEINYFLDILVYLIRYKINESMDNFENGCDLAQDIGYYYLSKLNCLVVPAMTQNVITTDITGHSFLVAKFNIAGRGMINYLIDPTYIQFFKKSECTKQKYFVSLKYPNVVLITPPPGYFIKSEDEGIVSYLLDHGHIELTENNARIYGDSFYNTKVGVPFTTLSYQSIPGKVYINAFLDAKEPLSKTEEELISEEQNIIPFSEKLEDEEKENKLR